MSKSEQWRARLREAVDRSWMKHAAIAREAGIAPATLSRILTGRSRRPGFALVVRIARAAGESIGWVLGERGYALSNHQRQRVRETLSILTEISHEE